MGTLFHGQLAITLPSMTGDDTVVGHCTPSDVEMIIEATKRHNTMKGIGLC